LGLVVHYKRLFSARYDILPRRRARLGQGAYGLRERRSVEHGDLTVWGASANSQWFTC
jgi:hypothetical protein